MEIKLTDGKNTAVIKDKGAELKSLILGGREIMWCADEKYWGKSSPFLFPMIGNLREGKTIINGQEYFITKHGFARDNVFNAKALSENKAEFTFVSNEETKKSFPFDFEVKLTYTLSGGRLIIDYTVENKSETDMYYCIGGHPAFACEDISDYKLIFEKDETVNSPVMNLKTRMWGDNNRILRLKDSNEFLLSYPLFDNDCVYFDTIKSKSCSLTSKKDGSGVKVSWEGFTSLGVWTPDHKNAPFICIEPWCGCDDYDTDSGIFAEKRGIQRAPSGKTKRYSITLETV